MPRQKEGRGFFCNNVKWKETSYTYRKAECTFGEL